MQSPELDPTNIAEFRQVLFWPLQLMPIPGGAHWRLLDTPAGLPWREHVDEFTDDATQFQERHYHEFTTFLPYVQRLLYGEGKSGGAKAGERDGGSSPMLVYRRADVTQARLRYPGADARTQLFDVVHIDLYFFRGMDVAILAIELRGQQLSLARVQETLFSLGRVYPTQWLEDGQAEHCMASVEWLSASGAVLASSDYHDRALYLSHVCRQRAPRVAAHWQFLLQPLVPHHSEATGPVRYRLVDYHRMPVMAYLAVNDPHQLTRGDFARLALVAAPGASDTLPYPEREMQEFEARCYSDRYWRAQAGSGTSARYLCSGAAMILVGSARDRYFVDAERGLLAQFRHQNVLLYLLPHFHKSALFMLSDRLVDAINHLDVRDPDSVRVFKRKIRETKRSLLIFTHGYWFHHVSAQPQAKELYRMCHESLDTERIYREVCDEVEDMNSFLDSDSLRRQANTVVRLTVVTLFGLIGTITTGFLGMNLLAEAESPLSEKLLYFALVFIPTIWLTLYTIIKSQRLSDFLDALSDERLPTRKKIGALLEVWRNRPNG